MLNSCDFGSISAKTHYPAASILWGSWRGYRELVMGLEGGTNKFEHCKCNHLETDRERSGKNLMDGWHSS